MTTVELAASVITTPSSPLGEDTPIVFVGSLGSTKSMWDKQREPLGKKFSIVFVDLRGHGESPCPQGPYTMPELAADVLAVLDREGFDKAHFVGLSLGGALVQQIALDHAERVASIALVSTAAKFGEPQAWINKAEQVRKEGTKSLADAVAHRWFTPLFGEQGAFTEYTAMVTACPDEGYAACCEALAHFDSRDRLSTLTVPTLVVSAKEDPSTPPEVVEVLADKIPGAVFEQVSPAAHLLNVEQPVIFNQLIADHVSRAAGLTK